MIDESFWKRSASEVAEDLVGRLVVEYDGINKILIHGTLSEVDAYDEPLGSRGEELYNQESGKLGVFSSRRGSIPIITSHVEDGSGLVTLRSIREYNADLQTTDIVELLGFSGETRLYVGQGDLHTTGIAKFLNFSEKSGSHIGENSGLFIMDRPFDLATQGLVVARSMPTNAVPNSNLVASYSLKKG